MILFILLVTIPSIIFGQSISVVPRLDEPIYTDDGDIVTFPRIIGGTQAQPGEIPGIVSVQTNSYRHFCGGTWIHATHIVTSAHCLTDESGRVYSPSVLAVMGDDTNISAANSSRQVKSVSHVFVHPQYNIDTIANDIAILRLTTAFVSTTRFQQMPRFSSIPPANTACVVAGWGVTAENNVQTNPYLLRVDVQIIDMITCNGSTSYQGLIPPSAFCAGVMVGGKDACQGDSGGPLICGNQLAGIVSFGYGCAKPRYPGVYTDVSKFSDWISNTIGHSGNNTSVPTPTTIKPGSNQASAIIVSLSLLLISLLIITT